MRGINRLGGLRRASSIALSGYGAPKDVLKVVVSEAAAASPMHNEVVVKLLAGLVTVEDAKQVRGLSYFKASSVAGTLGLASIKAVGAGVTDLAVNDKVLVVGSGAWSEERTIATSSVVKLTTTKSAKDLAILPSLLSAWALLNSFKSLNSGDAVIQSGGGPVSEAVIQLGKSMGVSVITATQGKTALTYSPTTPTAEVGLVLCASADMARPLQRHLAADGVMVAYSDSLEAVDAAASVDVPVSAAIFKKVHIRGFSLISWIESDAAKAKQAMAEVCALIDGGKVSAPAAASKKFALDEAVKALEKCTSVALVV